jgi:hypothetical protein
MTMTSNSNPIDTNNNSGKKHDKYQNFSAIKEHELDYERRLRHSEFTEGLSTEELIEKANTFPSFDSAPSSANKPQNEEKYSNNSAREPFSYDKAQQLVSLLGRKKVYHWRKKEKIVR